jgi:hypothetical protein
LYRVPFMTSFGHSPGPDPISSGLGCFIPNSVRIRAVASDELEGNGGKVVGSVEDGIEKPGDGSSPVDS